MRKKECIAMLLAGGQGSRLGTLTKKQAKPAVVFGGKYRIIDFTLSNCVNSGIDTVGVLTQYKPLILNSYIGTGEAWDLDLSGGGVRILPPAYTETGGTWYMGTADAIYQNIDFIDSYEPDNVLILSGDHLYRMDYSPMLAFHQTKDADLTISVLEVPWEEAPRFGVMSVDGGMRITDFEEKPKKPKSNLASMGIYIFKWEVLRRALLKDHDDASSDKDFGKNIIPGMVTGTNKVYAYRFSGYWKDVGTIDSYYEAQMGLLEGEPAFNIFDKELRVFSNSNISPPHFIGRGGAVKKSLVSNGCTVLGTVTNSILSVDTYVGAGAVVDGSILLPGARVEADARVVRAIVGEGAVIEQGACFRGGDGKDDIAVLGDGEHYGAGCEGSDQ